MHYFYIIRYDTHGLPLWGSCVAWHGAVGDPFTVAMAASVPGVGAPVMLAATPSAPQAAQKALQCPAIAPRSLEANATAPRAPGPQADRRALATLQRSDPQEHTALVSFVRVHWVASAALGAAMLAGFYLPLAESTLGSLTHVTWELHLASWLLAFLGGN